MGARKLPLGSWRRSLRRCRSGISLRLLLVVSSMGIEARLHWEARRLRGWRGHGRLSVEQSWFVPSLVRTRLLGLTLPLPQNSKKYPQAIVALQAALRGAPNDVHTWIKLGVAYRSSGKYIAALKVFDNALTIDPASWYAKFSIGDVQREIGLLEPALKAFRGIIDEQPTELGVRVVLAETALALGLDELKGGFLARAEESFIEALKETATIIDAGSATRIAWKVAGDTLTGLGKLPEPTLLDVSRPLAVRILAAAETHDVDAKIEGMDTITTAILQDHIHLSESPSLFSTLAVVAYKMRVLLETQNESSIGSAWFDLGISLSDTRRILDLDLPTLPADTLNQSIRCLKFALHKEPLNSIFWNALGVLSFDLSPRLSQHCFIKSIEHNSRSAVSWTNLGLFYLVQGDEDLANQSFLKAQVIDPDWAAAWVGQAALADLAGHIADASVLLEHASSLGGSTPEADIGYATRAYHKYRSTPEPPPATAALSGPLFALTRYLSHRPDDVSGLHLNALLLEQIGDLPTACASLEKAAAILEQLYEVDESPQVEAQFIIAQTNLGRVRLASLDYEGALAAFEAGQSLLNVTDEGEELNQQGLTPMGGLSRKDSILLLTECKLGSAMASYGLDDADTAVQVLESALEDIEGLDGERRADLAIALGRVYWSMGDEDRAFGSFMDSPDMYIYAFLSASACADDGDLAACKDSVLSSSITRSTLSASSRTTVPSSRTSLVSTNRSDSTVRRRT
jgi:superkiller protein 3